MCGKLLRAAGIASLLGFAPTLEAAAGPSGELLDLLPDFVTHCPDSDPSPGYERRSVYVPAEDGVKFAVDIYLPQAAPPGTRFPTLHTATRYWRAPKGAEIDPVQREWIGRGFAVVVADVRGTGASFGQWYIPYSPQEVHDIGFLASWIARQTWSDGKVVMTGNSYTGTTSLLGPAYAGGVLKATAPKFSDFDLYTDLLFPGGIATEALSRDWGRMVLELDLNQRSSGVRPTDGPDGESLLVTAVKEHNSLGFAQVPYVVTYSDEPIGVYHQMTMEDGGAYRYREQIESSRVPIFGWGSWLDSGIAQGLLNRFMTFSNPQLTIIGPWTHGARADANVFNPQEPLKPPMNEQNRMIACYLGHFARGRTGDRGAESVSSPPLGIDRTLVYYTMGEDRWKSTHAWPIPGTQMKRFYLDSGNSLSTERPRMRGKDTYRVDFDASTGPANRWATQAGSPRIDYGDRAVADKRLLIYTSQPLASETEITGQPIVTLIVSSTHTDGNFIVYLEDVAPDGQVTYLTEGEIRALHRKISSESPPYKMTYPYRTFRRKDAEPLIPGQRSTLIFQLQATSVLLRAGHRIRVGLAGADHGTFIRHPAEQEGEVTLHVSRGDDAVSFVDLPIVPAAVSPAVR